MSERRSLRSAKDIPTMHVMLDNTPRKSSRKLLDRSSTLQNTPDKTESSEMDKRSSRSVRSRRSRQPEADLTLDMENNNSLLNASILTANITQFEDTPTHLYGLDNPDNTPSVEESEPNTKSKQDASQNSTKKKVCQWILWAVLLLVCMAIVGSFTHYAALHTNQQKEDNSVIQIRYGDLATKLKMLSDKLAKFEQECKLPKVQRYQNVFADDKSFKGNGQEVVEVMNRLIAQAFNRWDADKIGIPDYALESSGGQIHSAYHSATFSSGAPQLLVFGIPLWYEVKTPRVIIQPGNTPGECWAFHGKEGFVVIKLSQTIYPFSFTLEHMAASLSQYGNNSIPSAPKDFSIWGWSDAHGKERIKLGEYVYDNEGTALQTFAVQASPVPNFRFIELRVHSNYGNPTYTCLYRFRVHGSPYKNNN